MNGTLEETEKKIIEYHQLKLQTNTQGKINNGAIESKQKAKDKMEVLSPHLVIITLNINGLNSMIKRHKMTG